MYAAGCICIQEDSKLLANYTWVVFGYYADWDGIYTMTITPTRLTIRDSLLEFP